MERADLAALAMFAGLWVGCGGVSESEAERDRGQPVSGAASAGNGGQPGGGGRSSTCGVAGIAGYYEVPSAGSAGTSGAPPIPSLPGAVECAQPSLEVPWPLVSTCEDGAASLPEEYLDLRCPFAKHVTVPSYGAFVGCCPKERPFGCANGTPWQCFATANQAAASCGVDSCVSCSAHDNGAGGAP